jgi:hypothetical protein
VQFSSRASAHSQGRILAKPCFVACNSNSINNKRPIIILLLIIDNKTVIIIKVIPVIIGATGTISESFTKYLSNISGKHEVKNLQKKAILGTAHILWKVLIQKYKTFNMGNNMTGAINCNHRIDATLHTLETVCFKYLIVNTLHKSDK